MNIEEHSLSEDILDNRSITEGISHVKKRSLEKKDDIEVSEVEESKNQPKIKQFQGFFTTIFSRDFRKRHRWVFHLFWSMFFTAWWISILAQPKHIHQWLIPTILWMCIIARFITFYVPARYLVIWASWIWDRTVIKVYERIPPHLRLPGAALGTVGVVLIGTFVTREYPDSLRSDRAVSFFGYLVGIFCLFASSNNHRKIRWETVISGVLIQYIVALFVLRTKAGYDIFNFISTLARELLEFAKAGSAFLTSPEESQLPWVVFTVLPAVIFFVAFVHIFMYWRWVQWATVKIAYLFFWAMKVSGAEAVVAAASPFLGQGESSILIKPFLPHMTKAEIHQIMTSGFSTIAGSMLVAYIGLGINPQAIVSSCIMSIPASLACAKLRYPETEETVTSGKVVIPEDEGIESADNVLHAFANGAWLGLIVAGAIMTTQMCIVALVALIDALLTWFGNFWNIDHLTLEMMLGYILFPVGFLLGVPRHEIYKISKLIGTKFIKNEFVAYMALSSPEYESLSKRGAMLVTYALCGFANLGSLGIQLTPHNRMSLFRIALPGFKLPPSSLRAVGVYASGAIFSLGFYAMLDAALYSSHKNGATVHVRFFPDWLPLLFSCIGMLVINLVEKARLQSALTGGSSFSSGEDWQAKVVLFLGFAFLAGGMASSIAVLVLKYALPGYSMPTLGMGVANVICNASVMISCVLLWVAQNIEDEYSYSLSL